MALTREAQALMGEPVIICESSISGWREELKAKRIEYNILYRAAKAGAEQVDTCEVKQLSDNLADWYERMTFALEHMPERVLSAMEDGHKSADEAFSEIWAGFEAGQKVAGFHRTLARLAEIAPPVTLPERETASAANYR